MLDIEDINEDQATRTEGCIRCTDCCRKYALNLNLGGPMADLLSAHYNRPISSIRVRVKHDCAQLQEDGSCAIYDTRPVICRNFLCQPALDRANGMLIVDLDDNGGGVAT